MIFRITPINEVIVMVLIILLRVFVTPCPLHVHGVANQSCVTTIHNLHLVLFGIHP